MPKTYFYVDSTHVVEHEIPVLPDKESSIRIRMSTRKQNAKQQILDNNIIRKSFSVWRFLEVLAKKNFESMRQYVDFRKLNALTRKHTYLLSISQ